MNEYNNLKLNESCMLNSFLNDKSWNHYCLCLNEHFYSLSYKLAVTGNLLEVRSPLTRSRIAVLI